MKAKEFRGKLKLNKKTITNLDNAYMKAVHGGVLTNECPSWIRTECTCGGNTCEGPPCHTNSPKHCP